MLGREFAEPKLITLAYAYEQATRHRRPPVTTPSLVHPPEPLTFEVETTPSEIGPSALSRFTFDWYTLNLEYSFSVAGVLDTEVLGSHIHRGTLDEPGPMIHLLGGRGEVGVSGTIKLSAEDLQDLFQGNLYVDVHTTGNVEGVNGQLIAPVE